MNSKTFPNTKNEQKSDQIVLGKGVDSLYLYANGGLDFAGLFMQADAVNFEEDVKIGQITFQRTKAHMRTYPVSIRHGAFTFYLNRASMYVQVGSLGFEMRGVKGCIAWLYQTLERMAGYRINWSDHFLISRLDVFTDFVFEADFNPDLFKSKLRRRGVFMSGDDEEAKTYYFGNRAMFCIRLYTKSAEIEANGKTYLKAQWKEKGRTDQTVWRLEFEFRKKKLERLSGRELHKLDEAALNMLWGYGIDQLKYMDASASHRNLYRQDLHPVWRELHTALFSSYEVKPENIKKANVEYRYKMARKMVMSYFAAKEEQFDEIPENIRSEFGINGFDYQKALKRVVLYGIDSANQPTIPMISQRS